MNKRSVLTIFLLSLAVRLSAGWPALRWPELAWCQDADDYQQLAAAILDGRFPSLFRTPGYPVFLALTGATAGEHIMPALLMQMLLDSLTAVLLALIAWRLYQSAATSLLTGCFYAFCPVMVSLCHYLTTEPLAIFLVTAAGYLLIHYESRWSQLGQAGLWFGATMTRPSYLLLPMLAVFFLWMHPLLNLRPMRLLLMLCVYAGLMVGWIGFNNTRFGMPVISSNPDVSFYIYDTAAVRIVDQLTMTGYMRLALSHPVEFDLLMKEQQQAYAQEMSIARELGAADLWFTKNNPAQIQQLRTEAVKRLQERWPVLLGIHLTGVLQIMRPKWNSAGAVFRLLDVARILLLLFVLLLLLQYQQWWALSFFGIWAAYALLPPGPGGAWRFRSLLEPFISLLLAVVLARLAHYVTRQAIGLPSAMKIESAA